MQNVQTEEVQTQKRKDIQKLAEVPRKVTLKKISRPTELDQQIVAIEDVTSTGKSKKHSSKINMDEGTFIPDQQVIHLDTPALRHRRRRQDVESNVITKNQSDNFGDSLEIITSGSDLDDGVVKTTKNSIRDRLWRDKLVYNGNTFDLNVKQLYRSTKG